MLNFIKTYKFGLAFVAAAFASSAFADTGFKVPTHYVLELADGISSPSSYSRMDRTVALNPGKHQIVISFKDTFGSNSDGHIIQAPDPIVVDIENLKPNQVITLKVPHLITEYDAEKFTRNQKVTIIDLATEKEIPASDASYFVMTSETGFTLLRDYRQELMSLGRLYAPSYVAGENRGIGMTAYGVPTVEATANPGNPLQPYSPKGQTMDVPNLSYSQENTMATSSKSGGQIHSAKSVSLKQLVDMYNNADDKTKLQFVKYVMSHE
ncbi:MAG TPA: hypothetical protein DCR21_06330 [Succinivibrionaceae bacterium]|nr:DUF2057 family protein [Succinivibrio sp.]HAR80433.1 hypothetical protein [Succinivibrionaceae bacterium]